MDDDWLRNLAADSMAQGFLIELLLTEHLRSLGLKSADRAQWILDVGQRTDHLQGRVRDVAKAEVLSDVVVRMHAALDGYVGRALARMNHPLAAQYAARTMRDDPES